MNRKLHNTAAALFASAGLLVLGLIAAAPMPVADADAFFATEAAWSRPDRAEAAADRIEARAGFLEQELAASRDATQAVAGVAAFAAEAATLAVMAETLDALEAGEAPKREATPRRKPRRSHQSVAMPFFSFAPRG
jgi:hypothetical protein